MRALVILALYFFVTQFVVRDLLAERTVLVKHYKPGLMQTVAAKRGMLDDARRLGVDGYASNIYCSRIGQVVTVRLYNPRTERWGEAVRLLIVDCSHPADRDRHIRVGPQLEVDYSTACRFGFNWDGRRGEGKSRAIILRYER